MHESPPVMLAPLYVLALLSFIGGWFDVPGLLAGPTRSSLVGQNG